MELVDEPLPEDLLEELPPDEPLPELEEEPPEPPLDLEEEEELSDLLLELFELLDVLASVALSVLVPLDVVGVMLSALSVVLLLVVSV